MMLVTVDWPFLGTQLEVVTPVSYTKEEKKMYPKMRLFYQTLPFEVHFPLLFLLTLQFPRYLLYFFLPFSFSQPTSPSVGQR